MSLKDDYYYYCSPQFATRTEEGTSVTVFAFCSTEPYLNTLLPAFEPFIPLLMFLPSTERERQSQCFHFSPVTARNDKVKEPKRA